jgi:chemotaxis protein CheX
MTIGVAPDQALVHAAFEQVWGAMLFTAIEPWPEGTVPELGSGVQAQIELRGHWNGRIVLTCDAEVATQIAGALLGAPAEEILPDEDVNDAVGEVLNVVGGSVKGALDGAMSLGLPGVAPSSTPPSADRCLVISWHGAPVFVEVVPDEA